MHAQIILHSLPDWLPDPNIQAMVVHSFFLFWLRICMPRLFFIVCQTERVMSTSKKHLLIHFSCHSQGHAFFHQMILFTCFWQDSFFSVSYISSSMFPTSTHETLSQKLYEKFKNHKRFAKPKLSRTAFTIQHYAGEVSISWNTLLFASAFNWIYSFQFPEFFFAGNLSVRSFPGQKQRLCSGRTWRIA